MSGGRVAHQEAWKESVLLSFYFRVRTLWKTNGVLAGSYLQIHNYLGDAAKDCDKIKNIPSISKVVLQEKRTFRLISSHVEKFHASAARCDSKALCSAHHKTKRHDLQYTLHGEEDSEGRV